MTDELLTDSRRAETSVRSARVDDLDLVTGRFDTLREHGTRYVRAVLDHCQGNKRLACRILNITYHTLRAHMRLPLPAPARFGTRRRSATYPSIYRHLLRSASSECPEGHANALHDYVKLARALVPVRGVFGLSARDEDSFRARLQEVGERWLGVAAAHQQLLHLTTTAMTHGECGSDEIEAVRMAVGNFQKRSDTAHFYAGLAFGLVFIEYGLVLSAPPSLNLSDIRTAGGPAKG